MEETETVAKAASSFGSKSFWSDGASSVQHSQQQQPVRYEHQGVFLSKVPSFKDCFCPSGGVPFIEQGLSTANLPASESAASSISSPTTTDSGLETCSKTTSREDLSDLEQCSSSAVSPNRVTALPGTEAGSPDAQVHYFTGLQDGVWTESVHVSFLICA